MKNIRYITRNVSGSMFQVSGSSGFTLVEVLVFLTLVSVVFIASAALTAGSLRGTTVAEHRVLATHYGEELREWLRGEKEQGWTAFPKSGTYCFNTSPIVAWGPSGDCGTAYTLGVIPNDIFKRSVTLSTDGSPNPTEVTIQITTQWNEVGRIYQVPVNTVFSIWE